MPIRLTRAAVAALATAVLVACDTPVLEPPTPSEASFALAELAATPATLAWQATARDLVSAQSMNALAAARLYAAVGVAQHLAVRAADAGTSAPHGSKGPGGPGGRSRYEARRGAVAGASARVLAYLVPAAAAALEQQVADQGKAGPGGVHPHFTRGVAMGRAAGDDLVARLASDGFTRPWTGSVPVGPGLWTTSVLPPGGAMLGSVRPYFLTSGSQFRPAPPPAFGSPAFDADVDEVLAITSSLTAAQLAVAHGWNWGGGTPTPPGYWNQLAASYVAADGLDEAAAAQVFALMSAAVFDALIACFEAKYHYWTLRPKQANPAIAYAFPVPNYPAYPSGHGSVAASAARVLEHFFPRRTAEIETLVDEAALSRIYAGIHYRFDMTAARTLGRQVGGLALARGLR